MKRKNLEILRDNGFNVPKFDVVEWSDKDEEHLLTIINVLEDRKNEQTEVGVEILNKQISWLKSLKNRCLPQSKQEWSDEDERIRKILMEYFKGRDSYRDEDETFSGIPFCDIISWLENIKTNDK